MKKLLAAIVLTLAIVGLLMPIVHAAGEVEISGVVRYQGHPIPDIEVLIECWDTGFSKRVDTDANGAYHATATLAQCPYRSLLKVRAETKNTVGYVGHRLVEADLINKLDIDTVPKGTIPEFGWVGGVVAAGAGIGAIAFMRRRYNGGGTSV